MATGDFFLDKRRVVTLDYLYQGLEKPDASEFRANSLIWDQQKKAWFTNPSGSWIAATFSGSAYTLNDLTNVNTSGATDGQALVFDAGTSAWGPATIVSSGSSASALNDLSDVTIVSAVDNDILYYDSSTSTWRRQPFSTQETYSSESDLSSDVKSIVSTVDVNTQTGTSYTLVLADAGKLVTMSNASASTLTVPANSSVAYPVGTVIGVARLGAGAVTVAGATGVTINGTTPGSESISGQYDTVGLTKLATDTWIAS